MSEVLKWITPIATLFSLIFIVWKVREITFKYNTSTFELYEKLRDLCGSDANKNYATLLVGLNSLTNKQLSPTQIEWFIYCPNAFLHLKRFDVCRRYIEVNCDNQSFEWRGRFTRTVRRLLLLTIVFFTYVACGSFAVLSLQAINNIFEGYGATWAMFALLGAIAFLLFAYAALREVFRILDARSLVNKGNISDLDEC